MDSNQAFEVIKLVRSHSGNGKQVALRQYPEIQPYLLAAYDPYKRYYTTVPAYAKGLGSAEFDSTTWSQLEQLHNRTLSGHDAANTCYRIVSLMTEKSAELFKMILNKDLRMGMGAKTINKVFPGLIPTHDIMLAKLFDKTRVKFPCFGSPKIDGVRAVFKFGKFHSRRGHIYPGLRTLEEQLKPITAHLDGELTVPGMTFQVGSGMIRQDTRTNTAQFNLFELPDMDDPFVTRLTMMKDMHLFGPNIVAVPHIVLNSLDEVMGYYADCRKIGYEGAVIKPYNYQYKGTRSYDWMKMKAIETVDLIVTGIYEGKGKYVGAMGGLIVDFHGQSGRVGGGFTDSQRRYFWDQPTEAIGRTIEILYMETTDDGNLRHSRFVRFRDDK